MKGNPLLFFGAVALALVVSGGPFSGCGSRDVRSQASSAAPAAGDARMVEVSVANFRQEVLSESGVVVVDFWAPWCGPCRVINPILHRLSGEFNGRIKVCKVNTDQNQKLATEYQIRGIPALLMFKNGTLIDSKVGAMGENDYRKWFNQFL